LLADVAAQERFLAAAGSAAVEGFAGADTAGGGGSQDAADLDRLAQEALAAADASLQVGALRSPAEGSEAKVGGAAALRLGEPELLDAAHGQEEAEAEGADVELAGAGEGVLLQLPAPRSALRLGRTPGLDARRE